LPHHSNKAVSISALRRGPGRLRARAPRIRSVWSHILRLPFRDGSARPSPGLPDSQRPPQRHTASRPRRTSPCRTCGASPTSRSS